MKEELDHDRRRFLGTAVMTLAATQFGAFSSTRTPLSKIKPTVTTTLDPKTMSSFVLLK
jgi:hypothetical protein